MADTQFTFAPNANPELEIRFDEAKLRDLEELLGGIPKALPRVLSRALNRAAMTMRSRVAHEAARNLKLPLRIVKSKLRGRWATPAHLVAFTRIFGKGFSLAHYGPRQNKKLGGGVTVSKGADAGFYPHAFIAYIRRAQRYPGVYRRVGKERFPVRGLYTRGLVRMVQEAGGWDQQAVLVLADLEKRLRAETERLLAGGKWSAVESALGESWEEWRSRMGPEEFR